ncbi:MAG: aldehyde dehydrogenase family protein, partial [Polyangia bacterium]
MNKPESPASKIFKARYGNFINGRWEEPRSGAYFKNSSPVNGQVLCEVARSNAQDVELALDAAHAAKDAWGRTSVAERAVLLNKIAQIMEDNLPLLAQAETWDNGKPIRETMAADLPLAIDHFRY